MADITRRLFLCHLRGSPTHHIRHHRRGSLAHDGVGLSFWFHPLTAVLSEVPVDDRELPLLFHARTRDFQDVTVQAAVTFRITDPAIASERVDFSIDPNSGRWRSAPLEQLASLLSELAQQPALDTLAGLDLQAALAEAVPAVRDQIAATLADDGRLAATGITVVGVRVVAIRPEPELERALQTPTRERVQQDADRATYERRARAVERERAIAENELQNKIELAKRQEQLVAQEGANFRRKAEEKAASARIDAEASAERDRLTTAVQAERDRALAAARAESTREVGLAEAEVERNKVAAYEGLDRAVITLLAVRELAGQLPEIGSLTITPDTVTDLLGTVTRSLNGRTGNSSDAA
jgi:regulator of protease activity HflC (stomatin/prohibitin superfamily)